MTGGDGARDGTLEGMSPFGAFAGVLGALSFGAGDFLGGLAARRAGALVVVAGAHGVGLVALLVGVAIVRPPLPGPDAIAIGLAAGVAGVAGLGALYRGMSLGSMGLVTSLAGAGSLALPLVAGALLGATVTPMQLLGCGGRRGSRRSRQRRLDRRARAQVAASCRRRRGELRRVVRPHRPRGARRRPVVGARLQPLGSALIAAVVVMVRGFDDRVRPDPRRHRGGTVRHRGQCLLRHRARGDAARPRRRPGRHLPGRHDGPCAVGPRRAPAPAGSGRCGARDARHRAHLGRRLRRTAQ